MAPPTASFASVPPQSQTHDVAALKKAVSAGAGAGLTSKVAKYEQYVPIKAGGEPVEDYEGNYVFADIKESHTSR